MDDAKLKKAAECYKKAVEELGLAGAGVRAAEDALQEARAREEAARASEAMFAWAMRDVAAGAPQVPHRRVDRHYSAVLGRTACPACALEAESCKGCHGFMELLKQAAEDLTPPHLEAPAR